MFKLKSGKIFWTILAFCTLATNLSAQNGKALHIGVSRSFDYAMGADHTFSSTDFQLGLQFEVMSGYLTTYGAYQLYGNRTGEYFEAYTFASHLLGAEAEYQSNREKVVALIVGVSLMTEIYTNFKNGYIMEGDPSLLNSVKPYAGSYYLNDPKSYIYYSTNHYQGTPLNASIWLGANFKIFQSFNVNLSIVNDIRIMSEKYLKWDMTDDEPDQVNLVGKDINVLIDSQPISRTVIDQFGLRLGLSYTFKMNKNK